MIELRQKPRARTFFELLCEQAERHQDVTALIAGEQYFTYASLRDAVVSAFHRMAEMGIGEGTKVGLLAPNQFEWLQVFFAANGLGATVVPISTWSTPREIAFLVDDARIEVLFARARMGERAFAADAVSLLRPVCTSLRKVVAIGDAADGAERYEDWTQPADNGTGGNAPCRATGIAFQLYTSGSSAHPKAVPMLNYAAIENGGNIGDRMALGPEDRVFIPVPLFWSYGAVNALPATLTHGATLVVQQQFDAGCALDLIEKHQCTAIYTLPAITDALLGHSAFTAERTTSLRTGLTIGTPEDVQRAANALGARQICNVYGSTETYGNCAVSPSTWGLNKRSGCQGTLLPGVRARVRDQESFELCEHGQVGVLEVSGYITPGYVGISAENNAKSFTEDGYFVTGDLVRMNSDDEVSFVGRSHEMIKRSGINVSPAEVEQVIQQLQGIGMVGVTGSPDPIRGERIVAFVTVREETELDADRILQHCKEFLSGYKIPDVITFQDALPLTPTGKLLRKELKRLAAQL